MKKRTKAEIWYYFDKFNPNEFHCIYCEYKTDNILDFLTHLQNKHSFKILTAKDVREYLYKK
jgi:hypothetical protein